MKIKDIVTKRLENFIAKSRELQGVIGNLATGDVIVANRPDKIYVTLTTGIVLSNVVNVRTPNIFGLEVRVGYDPNDLSKTLQVLSARETSYISPAKISGFIPSHREQHQWPSQDTVYVFGEQFLTSLFVPIAGTLTISIYPGTYLTSTGYKIYNISTTVSLVATAAGVTSGHAMFAIIVADAAGAFQVRPGDLVDDQVAPFKSAYELLDEGDIPALTADDTPICAVKLYFGQTEFYCNGQRNDFVDMRFLRDPQHVPVPIDANDVTYTPDANPDWDGGADPGNVDDALDQLAEHVKDLIPVNYAPTTIVFGNATQEYDIDGETWVAATAGVPDAASHLLPAALAAIATPYDGSFLSVREKTGAASATNPLTITFTFPAVDTFNVIKFRGEYDGSFSHHMVFELYNGATWDIFVSFSDEDEFILHSAEVLVPASYIIVGTVTGRFRHLGTGLATHHYELDYLVIASGGGVGAAGSHIDATDLTYTPAVLADWLSSADPGAGSDAFDQLAERVTDLESAPPPSGGHVIQDEGGPPLTARANLNFVGPVVTATDDAGNDATIITITAGPGGGDVIGPANSDDEHLAVWDGNDTLTLKDGGPVPGGGGHVIQDNATPMTARAALNFIGAIVTDNAVDDSTDVEIGIDSQIDQSGGTADTFGVLAGDRDGVNVEYTVSRGVYQTGKLTVYLNGQLQTQGTAEDWHEDNPATGKFHFTTAPEADDEIVVMYGVPISSATVLGSSGFVINEVPTGTIDGVNDDYVFANTPIAGTEQVFRNGQLQKNSGADYALSGDTITFVVPPLAGSIIVVSYQQVITTTGNADTLDGHHSSDFILWAAIQASQLMNEIKGWPPVVNTGDLDALNLWWDKQGTPTTAPTVTDTSVAGLTDTWELCLKVVADAASEGLYQRWTYADEPRVKAGRKLSALVAIWSVSAVSVTAKLLNSNASETAATAVTAAAWTIVEIPNHTLAGTYCDLQITAGAAGTFYVVPLGANIGARGIPLPPRPEIFKDVATTLVPVNDIDAGGSWVDVDLTATTSPLATRVAGATIYRSNTANDEVAIRRNGSTDVNAPASVRSASANLYYDGSFIVSLDDGNVFEYVGGIAAHTENIYIRILGWWEWA